MLKLNLDKKTGFSSLLPFEIFDEDGNLFYDSSYTDKIEKGERLTFNLPAGKYLYEGLITKLFDPVYYKPKKLPPKQRSRPRRRYKIVFGDNPNKCTIFYSKGVILFDVSFKKLPLYVRYNVYFHEQGHHFYKTEKYADLFAHNKMLKVGFNPSQIGRAQLLALDGKRSDSAERQKYIISKKILKK